MLKNKEYVKGDKVILEVAGHNIAGRVQFVTNEGAVNVGVAWLDLETVKVLAVDQAPRPLEVGDKVQVKNCTYPHDYNDYATIIAIVDDLIWIKTLVSKLNLVRSISNYERLPIN